MTIIKNKTIAGNDNKHISIKEKVKKPVTNDNTLLISEDTVLQ